MLFRRPKIRQRPKLNAPVAMAATAAVVGSALVGSSLLFPIAAIACLAVATSTLFTFHRLRDHTVRLTTSLLTEIDGSGTELGTIDLSRPFTYEFLYRGDGSAIYRLRQGSTRVDFASDLPEAEQVVRDIMGLEWPPRDKAQPSA